MINTSASILNPAWTHFSTYYYNHTFSWYQHLSAILEISLISLRWFSLIRSLSPSLFSLELLNDLKRCIFFRVSFIMWILYQSIISKHNKNSYLVRILPSTNALVTKVHALRQSEESALFAPVSGTIITNHGINCGNVGMHFFSLLDYKISPFSRNVVIS